MRMRRFIGVALVAAVVSMGAAACDVRVAGRKCSVNGSTAQDATHLLVCTKGRWTKSLTKVQIAFLLLAAIQSKTPASVAAGNGHTCATMENADEKCWGFNSSGQLGDGSTTNSTRPVLASMPRVTGGVDLGAEFGCSKKSDRFHASNTSQLSCWGFNGFGQLGDGTTTNRPAAILTATAVESFATGTVHTCASTEFMGVKCWGQNGSGQLGNGTTNPSSTPVQVTGMTGTDHTYGPVAAGGSHSCVLTTTGAATTPYCWGGNGSGQLGDGTTTQRLTPVVVALNNASTLSAGGEETCALLTDATVKCWGGNTAGQIGDGSTTARSTPTAVSGLTAVTSLSVGQDHVCAIAAGIVKCWGNNANGELGDGTTTNSATPITVPGISHATSVTAGFGHTCAVYDDGGTKLACWGRNDFGQLGDGTTTERHSPVAVAF